MHKNILFLIAFLSCDHQYNSEKRQYSDCASFVL